MGPRPRALRVLGGFLHAPLSVLYQGSSELGNYSQVRRCPRRISVQEAAGPAAGLQLNWFLQLPAGSQFHYTNAGDSEESGIRLVLLSFQDDLWPALARSLPGWGLL